MLYLKTVIYVIVVKILNIVPSLQSHLNLCRPASGLGTLIDAAGASLRHPEGHLYYLGARLFGVVGFIDSSEMVSTFGSSPHEVRGFVEGGWTACQNRTGE